jgi:hypothetical protein
MCAHTTTTVVPLPFWHELSFIFIFFELLKNYLLFVSKF